MGSGPGGNVLKNFPSPFLLFRIKFLHSVQCLVADKAMGFSAGEALFFSPPHRLVLVPLPSVF